MGFACNPPQFKASIFQKEDCLMLSKKERPENEAIRGWFRRRTKTLLNLCKQFLYILCSPILKVMDYILIKHKYRTNSSCRQWVIKESLLAKDIGYWRISESFWYVPVRWWIEFLKTWITFSHYGRLAIYLVTCEKLLLRKIKVQIEQVRAGLSFYTMSDFQKLVWN